MPSDRDGYTARDLRRTDDAFDARVAAIVRLLECLQQDWPEILRLVDEVIACESALEGDDSTAVPNRRRIGTQVELDGLNARLRELTHHGDVERESMWLLPWTH